MAHRAARKVIGGIGDLARGTRLMAHLHHAARRTLASGAHGFCVIHRERHGLFLIYVFAGVHGSHETFGMQVLRRGDQNRVNGFVFKQRAIIGVAGEAGFAALGDQALASSTLRE